MTNLKYVPTGHDHALIDCRSQEAFIAGHIAGATSLPAEELFLRMHELPQRHIPLRLCGDTQNLAKARQFLLERSFALLEDIAWSDNLAISLRGQELFETGIHSVPLWQPSPLLKTFIDDILPLHPAASMKGLDIACGSGRDTVYMAQQGWNMLGVDNSEDALQRCQSLAHYTGVNINTLLLDLEKNSLHPVAPGLQTGSFGLVMVFRYLHRPLLPWLQSLLAPGGFLIYQTFMQGCEKIGSPRNPRFLLEPGELATRFSTLDILQDTVSYLHDGRPVSAFVARKSFKSRI